MDESWSALSQRVKGKLGQALPDLPPGDPATPEFLELLTRLRQTDPDLAETVINVYTGTVEPLPSEVEAAAERRRQRLYQSLLTRFVRPDGLRTGRIRLNLRKTINYGVAAAAILLIIWSLVPKSPQRDRTARRGNAAASQNGRQEILPSLTLSPSSSRELRPRPSPAAGVPTATALPISRPGMATSPPIPSATRASNSPAPVRGSAPVITPPVVVFETSHQQGQSAPSVGERSESTSTQQQPVPVIVYDSSGTLAAGSQLPRVPSAPSTTTYPAVLAVSRGQLLEGKLVTPAVVSSSRGSTPTLVEITQGALQGAVLLGQATRSPEGLVLIQFNGFIAPDGREHPFRGTAYDPGLGSVGIHGQTTTMMPDASSALLAATMQSVGDYFTARARQPQVTSSGAIAGGQQGPTLWDGLASAVARAFAPSSEVPSGPTVVTRLDRGQIVTILVL
ncbi:MAG TPA: hypothetical protein VFV60_02175 [bacterium]|nr:hypothetical protein [bacterium]